MPTLKERIEDDEFSFEPLSLSEFRQLMNETDDTEFAEAFFVKSQQLFRYGHVLDDTRADQSTLNVAYALSLEKAIMVIENTSNQDLIDWYFATEAMFDCMKREPHNGPLHLAFRRFMSLVNDRCKDTAAKNYNVSQSINALF